MNGSRRWRWLIAGVIVAALTGILAGAVAAQADTVGTDNHQYFNGADSHQNVVLLNHQYL
jgi:hypothetical protein